MFLELARPPLLASDYFEADCKGIHLFQALEAFPSDKVHGPGHSGTRRTSWSDASDAVVMTGPAEWVCPDLSKPDGATGNDGRRQAVSVEGCRVSSVPSTMLPSQGSERQGHLPALAYRDHVQAWVWRSPLRTWPAHMARPAGKPMYPKRQFCSTAIGGCGEHDEMADAHGSPATPPPRLMPTLDDERGGGHCTSFGVGANGPFGLTLTGHRGTRVISGIVHC